MSSNLMEFFVLLSGSLTSCLIFWLAKGNGNASKLFRKAIMSLGRWNPISRALVIKMVLI